MVHLLAFQSDYGCVACLWQVGEPYKTGVCPSLVLGSDINQKSVFHYSVIRVSVLYVIPIMCVSCEAVEPAVSNHLIPI